MKKFYLLLLALGLFTGVEAQIINIPDANFKAKLLAAGPANHIAKNLSGFYFKIDANSDGEIQTSEAIQVSQLSVSNSFITSLEGILNFTNLNLLGCTGNQLSSLDVNNLLHLKSLGCQENNLTSLNVSALTNLEILSCYGNNLTSLNVSTLTNLEILRCFSNQLASLNLSGLTKLKGLYCGGNSIPSLNLSGLMNLATLQCESNLLTSLDLSGLPNLSVVVCISNQITSLNLNGMLDLNYLNCNGNLLTTLDFPMLDNLVELECGNNLLTSLDVSNLKNLERLWAADNPNLVMMNLKNGLLSTIANIPTDLPAANINFSNCPILSYVCIDEEGVNALQNKISVQYGYTNCNLNSYCSFEPGGNFYTVKGYAKYDGNNNGCEASDLGVSNLKLGIADGTVFRAAISDVSGNYTIPTLAGVYTITPVLENASYFTISPSTVNVTFPTQASPLTQNFCITPNGSKQDLEVILLPLVPSVPGFDARFKIIYKNKGTVTQSGSVVMDYFDHVADFVSSIPALSNESGNLLTWDFVNLQPFETREITFTVNINNPMETPAVNIGDIISFEAYVYPLVGDLTPNNNHSGIRQVVVGSFDPNDKTCLEGNTITPDKVGEYVHYMIRFENTGTFPAENIVVKDMIDTDKFDVSSIVPIKGSHSFVTNITAENKVEFIFENINLPFDNANNDGYVAFKIKTKPTLVLGNTFSNTASIYFDYNFPIVTNTATTTIAALAVQDFEFSNYFKVYPNPVQDVLNITSKGNIEVSSINIYNTLGQLVLVIPNAKDSKTVDVSGLSSGNYFIKINSDKGSSNTKFIKN